MTRRRTFHLALGSLLALAATLPAAQPATPPVGELKSLGQDRYQVGRIVVDKSARTFTAPGRINVVDKPLEYLATTSSGRKAYESLLVLDASGSEFNLACILIGLERDPDVPPSRPPKAAAITGQRVVLSVAWTDGGKRRELAAADALFGAGSGTRAEAVDWVYTGSFSSRDGSQFAADHTGSLIGFIHDPTTVIETTARIGIGAYGSVRGSSELPAVGTGIELIVKAVGAGK